MNSTSRTLAATSIAVAAALAGVIGNSMRSRTDLGPTAVTATNWTGVVASKDGAGIELPEEAMFEATLENLRASYVEPITDEEKLAVGSVRGMVNSLADPNSLFLDKAEFSAYTNSNKGKLEGIGAEFVFQFRKTGAETVKGADEDSEAKSAEFLDRIPRLTIASVAPGSAADQAGLKPGDWIDQIDGKWVVDADQFRKLRELQAQFEKKKVQKDELLNAQRDVRKRLEHSLMPIRAKDYLFIGKEGTFETVWRRGDTTIKAKLTKGTFEYPVVRDLSDGALAVRFIPGAAETLKQKLEGKDEITLDLRGNASFDFKSMRECLALIVPDGSYGWIRRNIGIGSEPLKIAGATPTTAKVTILVDDTTRRAAEVFALAAKASKRPNITVLGPKMSGDPTLVDLIGLPDGSGYTLATGIWIANKEAKS